MPITTVPPSIITNLGTIPEILERACRIPKPYGQPDDSAGGTKTPAPDDRPQDGPRLEIPRPVIPEINPPYVATPYDPHLKTKAMRALQRVLNSGGDDEADPLSRFVKALETNPGLLIPFNDGMAEYTKGSGETDGVTVPLLAMWSGILCVVAASPILKTRFNTPRGAFPDYIRQLYEGLNTRYDVTDPEQHIRLLRLLGELGANPAFPKSHLPAFRKAMRCHGTHFGANTAEIKGIIGRFLAKRADKERAQ